MAGYLLEAAERCRPCWYWQPIRSSVAETPRSVFLFPLLQIHDYSASTVPQYCFLPFTASAQPIFSQETSIRKKYGLQEMKIIILHITSSYIDLPIAFLIFFLYRDHRINKTIIFSDITFWEVGDNDSLQTKHDMQTNHKEGDVPVTLLRVCHCGCGQLCHQQTLCHSSALC